MSLLWAFFWDGGLQGGILEAYDLCGPDIGRVVQLEAEAASVVH